ncbi:glutamine--fructose-6-phosphate transaminase (isomerizing) [Hydrogenophilus islandicus]
MCGIVAAVAAQGNVVDFLLEGLARLEYRGYDSAGVAVVAENGELLRQRGTARVAALADAVRAAGIAGTLGIAHTRWATHGVPSEANAHPHVVGGVALVHNGIIENANALRAELTAQGATFTSETDTEVIVQLVAQGRAKGLALRDAVIAALERLEGAFAIAVIDRDTPQTLIVARRGSPLVIGLGEGANYTASDVAALVSRTRQVITLENGDVAELTPTAVRVFTADGTPVERPVRTTALSADAVALGGYRHYMQKEIFEQPQAIADTVGAIGGGVALGAECFGVPPTWFDDVGQVLILGCGTSYHAGMVARYWLEAYAGIPTTVEIASEYRYRQSVPNPTTLVVAISQSGETADTLAALEHAHRLGMAKSLAICNVPESALTRVAATTFLTHAGPEIGVASTKAFTTQLVALALLTLTLAKQRGRLSPDEERMLLTRLRHLPVALQAVLAKEEEIAAWATRFAEKDHALFLGRGVHWPIAMEGALKLKEISYIHAEAYPAGELKHGPLALVDARMPVVAVAPNDQLLDKLMANLEEVRARGGELFVFADQGVTVPQVPHLHALQLPEHYGFFSPIVHVVPLQLLAYHVALVKGTDVDKPRNLAKSVTVE